jgi:NitT/TauT family transport system ATP-binding protein
MTETVLRANAPVYVVNSLDVVLRGRDGPRPVLSGISFDVRPGEVVGVVGRSGVGKTTLLRVLAGLLPASGGTVRLRDEPVNGPPDGVVMVFQDYVNALLPWRTVHRNVALGLERRVGSAERNRRVEHALATVGLSGRGRDHPAQLSGGMAQRVQIARALVMEPAILLMDEPFGALDAITKASLQDLLLHVQSLTGATIVFVTHDLDEAIYLGDRVVVIAGRPGAVTHDVPTRLPRPRDQLTSRALGQYQRVRVQLGEALHDDG